MSLSADDTLAIQFKAYERPRTFDALMAAWNERDATYDRFLTASDIEAIRQSRKVEADWVEPYRRAEAWRIAASWVPRSLEFQPVRGTEVRCVA